MRGLLAVGAAMSFIAAAPAIASDEPLPPPPSTGGPVATIPVDPEQIRDLIVSDIRIEPTVDLRGGDMVQVTGRIAAGAAPERTVVVIQGVGEIEGDVAVDADGTIDHVIQLPDDLPAGDYELSLLAAGLGIATIGTIQVVGPAPAEPLPEAGTDSTPAPATTAPPPPQAQSSRTNPERNVVVFVIGGGLAILALVGVVALLLRRRRSIASFVGTTPLPTATTFPGRSPPHDAEDEDRRNIDPEARPGPTPEQQRPEPAAGAAIPSSNATAPDGLVAAAMEEDPGEPGDARSEPGTPLDKHPAGFAVVELVAQIGAGEGVEPQETIIATYDLIDDAKVAARQTRTERDLAPTEEVWWEIRPAGREAVWMVHAWAPREYDLDAGSGEATPVSR